MKRSKQRSSVKSFLRRFKRKERGRNNWGSSFSQHPLVKRSKAAQKKIKGLGTGVIDAIAWVEKKVKKTTGERAKPILDALSKLDREKFQTLPKKRKRTAIEKAILKVIPFAFLKSVWSYVTRFFGIILRPARKLLRAVQAVAIKLIPQSWLQRLERFWRPFKKASELANVFFTQWGKSRNYFQLLWGVPAVALVLPLLICVVCTPFYSNSAKAMRYRTASMRAVQANEPAKASLYRRKLRQLGGADDATEFVHLVSAAKDGDYEGAYRQMQGLAPVDTIGYLPAHVWMALSLYDGKIDMEPARALQLAEKHLELVLQRDPDLIIAHWLLGRVYVKTVRHIQTAG